MPECEECNRLWNDYQKATYRYFHWKGKLGVAHLSGDRESEEKVARLLQKSVSIRIAMREQIAAHKADAHGDKGAAAGADSGIEHF